ncbi:B-cell receptor CD22-like [Centroberyx affinis]|uniref:B-cell receptor CD22-like n=1 Tax=Centroberyx affinis TaxID=166261 RepID=UPI003A5BCE97
MGVEHANLTCALILLFLSGVPCRMWKVGYQQQHICAVKGSSVAILCSYYYPKMPNVKLRVKRVIWGHERYNIYDGPFIFDSQSKNNATKFEYIGNIRHNCSFKIHQVEHNDSGKYIFRFITNSKKGKWTGVIGSTLKVVDLKVLVMKPNGEGIMKEGESVNLTCVNGCDGGNHSSAIAWFKDGEPFNEGPVLYIHNMSSTSSGSYACSLKKHTGTLSEVVSIHVEYGPKNTSVSVRLPDTGGKIRLVCSSDANPPVDNYTWFAIDDDDAMAVGHHRELHFDGFGPADGGQYLCSVTNTHGSQNSSIVTLKIKRTEATVITNMLVIATITMLFIVTVGVAIKRLCKRRMETPETDFEENIQNTAIYVNWPMFDNSQSQAGSQREGEPQEVTYATVHITKRMANIEQQMDTHDNEHPVIYSSVCRNQLLNSS